MIRDQSIVLQQRNGVYNYMITSILPVSGGEQYGEYKLLYANNSITTVRITEKGNFLCFIYIYIYILSFVFVFLVLFVLFCFGFVVVVFVVDVVVVFVFSLLIHVLKKFIYSCGRRWTRKKNYKCIVHTYIPF